MQLKIKYDDKQSVNSLHLAYAAIEAKNVDLCITLLKYAKNTDYEYLCRAVLQYGTKEQLRKAYKIKNPRLCNSTDPMYDISLFEYQADMLENKNCRTEIEVFHKNEGKNELILELEDNTFNSVKKAVYNSNCPRLISDFAKEYNNVDKTVFRNKVVQIGNEYDVKHFDYLFLNPSEVSEKI